MKAVNLLLKHGADPAELLHDLTQQTKPDFNCIEKILIHKKKPWGGDQLARLLLKLVEHENVVLIGSFFNKSTVEEIKSIPEPVKAEIWQRLQSKKNQQIENLLTEHHFVMAAEEKRSPAFQSLSNEAAFKQLVSSNVIDFTKIKSKLHLVSFNTIDPETIKQLKHLSIISNEHEVLNWICVKSGQWDSEPPAVTAAKNGKWEQVRGIAEQRLAYLFDNPGASSTFWGLDEALLLARQKGQDELARRLVSEFRIPDPNGVKNQSPKSSWAVSLIALSTAPGISPPGAVVRSTSEDWLKMDVTPRSPVPEKPLTRHNTTTSSEDVSSRPDLDEYLASNAATAVPSVPEPVAEPAADEDDGDWLTLGN